MTATHVHLGAKRRSTSHARGSGRPKSHSGKRKPGARKQLWLQLAAQVQSRCQGDEVCQAALKKMSELCAELTAALASEKGKVKSLENIIEQLQSKANAAAYVRPVRRSWQL